MLDRQAMSARSALHPASSLLSLGLIALGTFVVYETQTIAETPGLRADRAAAVSLHHRLRADALRRRAGVAVALRAAGATCRSTRKATTRPDWMAFGIISAGIILHMVIIGWAGFIIASTVLFVLVARGFGSRRIVRDALIALVLATVVFFIFTPRPGPQSAQGSVRGRASMETFSALMSGFAVALTLKNLLWGFVGVTLGTAIGVLPGIGPALTIALLLPATAQPRSHRRADHVRRHLLRRDVRRLDDVDPAQHAGRVGDDRHRDGRQPDGQARPRRAGAGDRGDRLVRRRHDRDARCSP